MEENLTVLLLKKINLTEELLNQKLLLKGMESKAELYEHVKDSYKMWDYEYFSENLKRRIRKIEDLGKEKDEINKKIAELLKVNPYDQHD